MLLSFVSAEHRFPFDDQLCFLKFGSWTYDSTQVILTNRSENVDMLNYVDNGTQRSSPSSIGQHEYCHAFVVAGEWKLLSSWTVLSRLIYPCCDESYFDLKFYFHIRRRTLYYTYNVIIPCIMLSILTCLTFYLPTESGEKVSLGLTVLLAFSVFMLLIAESMPATSEYIPLISKTERHPHPSTLALLPAGIYFTLVMSLTSLSVLLAVILLNVHHYGSSLKPVPAGMRRLLLYRFAPFLRVKLHRGSKHDNQKHPSQSTVKIPRRATTIYNAIFLNESDLLNKDQPDPSHTLQSAMLTENNLHPDAALLSTHQTPSQSLNECKRLLTELNRVILRPTESHEEDAIVRDWQNVALVLDRCLFILYILLTGLLTIGTLVLAPLLKYVPRAPGYHQLNITRD